MLERVRVIIEREIKKTYSNWWSLPLAIVLPLVIIFLMGSAFGSFVKIPGGVNYTQFLGPGIVVFFVGIRSLGIGYAIIEDRKGFLKRLLVTPISRYAILFGYGIGNGLHFLLTGIIILTIFFLRAGSIAFINFLLSIALLILTIIGLYGFGVGFSSLFINKRRFRIMSGFLNFFMTFFSGAFYPLKTLPIWLKIVVYLNPLTYAVDAMRFVVIGTNEISIMVDIGFLLVFSVLSVFLGTYMFERNLKQ